MGSHHSHSHHHGSKNILVAFFLNFTFAIIELIGGYYTNSVAIISDAIHDFGDSLALLFSYFAEKLSQKEANKNYTFGYRRFSILSAFVNGLILFLGSLYVIYEAIGRILNPEAVKAEGMIFLAILGICVNSFAAYRLSKDEGLNSKMVMYHLFEDLLGWVAVLIVSIILLFKPWYQLDSILSILISLIILRGVYKNLKKVAAIFLQKFPDDLKLASLKDEVSELDLVQDIHAVKGLSIDDTSYYLSFHIKVPEETMIKEIDFLRIKVKSILKKYGVEDSTIEFESICEKL
jgi:cobalt-zinc-cadmium efflux system protein